MSLCLNMIVKDEAHVIEKTLQNLDQYIIFDYYVICDTGSSDNTKEIIKNHFFKFKKILKGKYLTVNGKILVLIVQKHFKKHIIKQIFYLYLMLMIEYMVILNYQTQLNMINMI